MPVSRVWRVLWSGAAACALHPHYHVSSLSYHVSSLQNKSMVLQIVWRVLWSGAAACALHPHYHTSLIILKQSEAQASVGSGCLCLLCPHYFVQFINDFLAVWHAGQIGALSSWHYSSPKTLLPPKWWPIKVIFCREAWRHIRGKSPNYADNSNRLERYTKKPCFMMQKGMLMRKVTTKHADV